MSHTLDWGDPRLPDAYWQYVYPCPVTGCWLWGGPATKKGYGTIRVGGKKTTAHRIMLSLFTLLSRRLVAMHSCDTPWCVRPEHLSAGTQSQNIRDAVAKGRHRVVNKLATPTVCPKCGGQRTPNKRSGTDIPQWHCPICQKIRRSK